jgi:hypothetical protein
VSRLNRLDQTDSPPRECANYFPALRVRRYRSCKKGLKASNKMIPEKGTVPFSSPGTGKLGQSPIILLDAVNYKRVTHK